MDRSENIKDIERQNAANEAVKYIKDNDVVGLGTGSTAYFAIKSISELVRDGLKIKGVPTSEKSAVLAANLGIELLDLNEVNHIDVTIDGADEFNKARQLIKGGGGALFREKIVALLTTKEIIIADASKYVTQLGKFKVPVEVVPLALNYVQRQLSTIGGNGSLRQMEHTPFITDNGNYILDADFGLIDDANVLSEQLNGIEGILAHGLFVNLASMVIMGKHDGVVIYH